MFRHSNETEWYNRLEFNAKQADGQDDADRLQRDTAELLARWTFGFEHQFSQSLWFETRLQLASRRFTEEPLNNDDEAFRTTWSGFLPNGVLIACAGGWADNPLMTRCRL